MCITFALKLYMFVCLNLYLHWFVFKFKSTPKNNGFGKNGFWKFSTRMPTDILHLKQKIQTANKYRHTRVPQNNNNNGGDDDDDNNSTFVSDTKSKWCGKVTFYLHHKTTVQHFDNNIKLDKICNCSKFNFLVHMKKWLYLVWCCHVYMCLVCCLLITPLRTNAPEWICHFSPCGMAKN